MLSSFRSADMFNFQQQFRQEMAELIQQVRTELNELNGIATALQQSHIGSETSSQETGNAATTRDNSDISRRTCTCGCKHGLTKERQCSSSVGCTAKFDCRALSEDCSQEKFGTIEASLYQVLQGTTANEPLRTVQQTQGQKGFEAWCAVVARSREEVRSEEHARPEFSTPGTGNQQHH